MCQLMALPPSQLRDVPSLTPSAGQPSSSHSTSGKIELVQTTQNKGFHCKKGNFSSASPSIQSRISNRLCYTLFRLQTPGRRTLCHHKPVTTSPCTRPTVHLLHPELCESQENHHKAELQGLPGLCISDHATQLQFEQSRQLIKLHNMCFYTDIIFEI